MQMGNTFSAPADTPLHGDAWLGRKERSISFYCKLIDFAIPTEGSEQRVCIVNLWAGNCKMFPAVLSNSDRVPLYFAVEPHQGLTTNGRVMLHNLAYITEMTKPVMNRHPDAEKIILERTPTTTSVSRAITQAQEYLALGDDPGVEESDYVSPLGHPYYDMLKSFLQKYCDPPQRTRDALSSVYSSCFSPLLSSTLIPIPYQDPPPRSCPPQSDWDKFLAALRDCSSSTNSNFPWLYFHNDIVSLLMLHEDTPSPLPLTFRTSEEYTSAKDLLTEALTWFPRTSSSFSTLSTPLDMRFFEHHRQIPSSVRLQSVASAFHDWYPNHLSIHPAIPSLDALQILGSFNPFSNELFDGHVDFLLYMISLGNPDIQECHVSICASRGWEELPCKWDAETSTVGCTVTSRAEQDTAG